MMTRFILISPLSLSHHLRCRQPAVWRHAASKLGQERASPRPTCEGQREASMSETLRGLPRAFHRVRDCSALWVPRLAGPTQWIIQGNGPQRAGTYKRRRTSASPDGHVSTPQRGYSRKPKSRAWTGSFGTNQSKNASEPVGQPRAPTVGRFFGIRVGVVLAVGQSPAPAVGTAY